MTGQAALSEFTAEQLAQALRAMRNRRELEGRIAAELHDVHGWTWEQIAGTFQPAPGQPSVDLSTVSRWAKPYRKQP